jgi:hypothetical protein
MKSIGCPIERDRTGEAQMIERGVGFSERSFGLTKDDRDAGAGQEVLIRTLFTLSPDGLRLENSWSQTLCRDTLPLTSGRRSIPGEQNQAGAIPVPLATAPLRAQDARQGR